MQRRSKIVATLGPATDDIDVLTQMCQAGLDVARVNFSHGNVDDHLRRINLLREASRRARRYVAI
jgi:pyruvate kinase